jgi:predicted dehydrogenase
MRYAAHVRQAADIVSQGFLGRITTARFHCGVPAPELTGERFAAGDRGGMVYSEFCDVLDLLSLYLGTPSEALARFARHEDFARHPFEDAAAILLRFGGVLAAGDCCGWEAQPWKQSWDLQLFGNEGCLELELGRARLRLFLRRANAPYPAGWTTYEDPGYDPLDDCRRELEDVARRVLVGQTPSGVDIEGALRLGEILERMYGEQGL